MVRRRFYKELQGDLALLSARDLQGPLNEIASGTSSFGPAQEWYDWYHYLLGEVLPRSQQHFVYPLLESLITGFIALYPNGVGSAPYDQFRDDALRTIGKCIMDEHCWNGPDIFVEPVLPRSNSNPAHVWGWWGASSDFTASMFFCLKYLPASQVQDWLESVLEIASPHWRAQIMVWLVGAHDLLTGRIDWPSELHENAYPSVTWDWSHCLRPELAATDGSGLPAMTSLLSENSRARALEVVHGYFTEDTYLDWLFSIATVSSLEEELLGIPSSFETLYVRTQ